VLANKPLAPDGSRDMGSFESQMKTSFEMMEKEKPKSWFARELTEPAENTLAEWFEEES